MRHRTQTKTCEFCYIEYSPQYGRPNQKFCSNECYLRNRWGEPRKMAKCGICGKPCRLSHHKYCSWDCAQVAKNGRANPGRSNRVSVECEQCGVVFSRPATNFHSEKKFCSRLCMAAWQSENTKQANHPRWRGGPIRGYGVGWRAAKIEALRLANYTCKRCKKPGRQVHHMLPVRYFKKKSDAHSQSNLMVLCARCHPREEKRVRAAMPLLDLLRHVER